MTSLQGISNLLLAENSLSKCWHRSSGRYPEIYFGASTLWAPFSVAFAASFVPFFTF